jgi:tRNA(Met) C34 N-acetyltransferase TmcA
MLVLQDYEAITPNLLARTIETVEGGGIVVLLLKTMSSLKQLYTMAMVSFVLLMLEETDIPGRTFSLQDGRTSIRTAQVQRAIHPIARIMSRLFAAR